MTVDADTSLPRPAAVGDRPPSKTSPAKDSDDGDQPPEEIGFDDDQPSSAARAFVDWVVVVAVALTVAFLVRGFLLAHYEVEGSSMDTTLHDGDRVFVNKMSYRLHDPNRGDVVVLHQINGSSERDLIKRVIALPGETIEMTNCEVRITESGESESRVLVEPYLNRDVISETCGGDFEPVSVPADSVFVMGDNRSGSMDSRSPQVGPISYDNLVGRAFVVFWPRSDWTWL